MQLSYPQSKAKMSLDKRSDPAVLENSVKELITSAKNKISALTDEVATLRARNEELVSVLGRVKIERENVEIRLQEIEGEIKSGKETGSSLVQLREDKKAELGRKKDEFARILEGIETEQRELKERVRKLTEEEKGAREEKMKESAEIIQQQIVTKKNIAKLEERLRKRAKEMEQMREEIRVLSEKEKARLAALENEKKKLMKFVASK